MFYDGERITEDEQYVKPAGETVMQRKRGDLVPIGEALADLPGPVKVLRETPPAGGGASPLPIR